MRENNFLLLLLLLLLYVNIILKLIIKEWDDGEAWTGLF
jgi:hypothetical protein